MATTSDRDSLIYLLAGKNLKNNDNWATKYAKMVWKKVILEIYILFFS
jgi:hypothetical protein